MSAILGMLSNPEVQARAHDELDRVLGKDTLPSFEDKMRLPYINAICTEALRLVLTTTLSLITCAY